MPYTCLDDINGWHQCCPPREPVETARGIGENESVCHSVARPARWARVTAVTGALIGALATPASAQQTASLQVTASVIQVPLQQQVTDSVVTTMLGDVAHIHNGVVLPGGVRVDLSAGSGSPGSFAALSPRRRSAPVVEVSYTAS